MRWDLSFLKNILVFQPVFKNNFNHISNEKIFYRYVVLQRIQKRRRSVDEREPQELRLPQNERKCIWERKNLTKNFCAFSIIFSQFSPNTQKNLSQSILHWALTLCYLSDFLNFKLVLWWIRDGTEVFFRHSFWNVFLSKKNISVTKVY